MCLRAVAHAAGLDAIQEQQPYKGLSPGMLQALSQLGMLASCTSMSSCSAAAGCQVVLPDAIELTDPCQPAFIGCITTLQPNAHHLLLLDVIVVFHCFLASTAIDRRPSASPVSLQQQQQVQQQQAQQQQQQLLNQLAGYQEGTCAYCSLL